MRNRVVLGWSLVCLITTSTFLPALAYPSISGGITYQPQESSEQQQQPQQQYEPDTESRKFAEKPNSVKKIAALEDRNDLDDLSTNQIPDNGFSWSNMIAMFVQMLFPAGSHTGPTKSDSLDADTSVAPSPWANLLTVGLKILTAILGGGAAGGDGIDKVDNASSPMQFINIVVNLLDALKTSFSHRSLAARSIGKKDSVSEAAVASLSIFKGYVKTMKTADENCMLKYMCDANRECSGESGGPSSIYCQLGTYVASFMLQRSGNSPFDSYYDAGRRGRSGDDCQQIYLSCNEV